MNLTVNLITKLVGFSANYQLRHIDRWLIGAIPVNPIAGGSPHVHVAFLLVPVRLTFVLQTVRLTADSSFSRRIT